MNCNRSGGRDGQLNRYERGRWKGKVDGKLMIAQHYRTETFCGWRSGGRGKPENGFIPRLYNDDDDDEMGE